MIYFLLFDFQIIVPETAPNEMVITIAKTETISSHIRIPPSLSINNKLSVLFKPFYCWSFLPFGNKKAHIH